VSLNPSKPLGDELLIHYQVYLRKTNMLVDFAENMPFCRECGKDVQDDWATCPHCSCSLNISSQNVSLQDTVVMGNINSTTVNDSKTKCAFCGSVGVTQIACSVCKKMSHCNICETEVHEERRTERICGLCHQEIIVKRTAQAKEQEEKKNKENYQKAVHRNERNKLAKINRREQELARLQNVIKDNGIFQPVGILIVTIFGIISVVYDEEGCGMFLIILSFCLLIGHLLGRKEDIARVNDLRTNPIFFTESETMGRLTIDDEQKP
jgi:hypothetical protein